MSGTTGRGTEYGITVNIHSFIHSLLHSKYFIDVMDCFVQINKMAWLF